jgi:segregation and condensation protein A
MSQPTPPVDEQGERKPQAPRDAQPVVEAGDGDDAKYQVHVDSFDGPLDLLLHLVRTHELDITDIPIMTITSQYNAYLDLMREFDLEVAGEYLVMAATLMHIKSQMLLPADPDALEEESIDPRAELTQQLLDYQRFKQAAESLQAMESRRGLIWTRNDVPEEFADEELLAVDVIDLHKAFRKLLARLGDEARRDLRKDTVSVAEKIGWLTDMLEEHRSIKLLEVMADLPTRLDRVATFLAVLELMKLSVIVVFQRKLFDEIRVSLRPEQADADPAPAES